MYLTAYKHLSKSGLVTDIYGVVSRKDHKLTNDHKGRRPTGETNRMAYSLTSTRTFVETHLNELRSTLSSPFRASLDDLSLLSSTCPERTTDFTFGKRSFVSVKEKTLVRERQCLRSLHDLKKV